MSERGLLLVAVRVDHPAEVRRRIETVLAVAATYERPAETEAAVWCKSLGELVASDLDALAGLIGWDATRRLNVGDVVTNLAGAGQAEAGQRKGARGGARVPVTEPPASSSGSVDRGKGTG